MPVSPEKVLFQNVSILDSTGAGPYPGDVLVENDRIAAVGHVDEHTTAGARVIDGRGRTLMSGLCGAHTHFSWNNSADLDGLGTMPVEEHLLFCLESARTYLDSGYTMCLGAASAKDRLDVVCRNAIDAGRFPGPRYLANGPEIAVTGGALIKSITKFADGPDGMRKAVRELIDLGVDQSKLSMTGEEITGTQRAEDTYFSDEECAAAVTEAHRRGQMGYGMALWLPSRSIPAPVLPCQVTVSVDDRPVAASDLPLACHLADYALEAQPDDPETRRTVASLYELRAAGETSLMARNLFRSAAAYARAGRPFC